MRLVKKDVNQDDVSAYHLFSADGNANPGTDLTFFDFRQRRSGAEQQHFRTGLRVAGEKKPWLLEGPPQKAGGHTREVTRS